MQAPDLPKETTESRKPYGIAFVIDRSGSMGGKPINEAIRCVNFMVDRLLENDLAAVVTFDNQVTLDYPLSVLSDKSRIKTVLATVHAGGTTNLHGGWRVGADEFIRQESVSVIKRVVLLSYGRANEGLTNSIQIASQVEEFSNRGITTSTYGLGRDFNEELMVDIAKAGQGNHYYAETAEDLLESFNEEFELMANLWAKDIVLSVKPQDGVQIKLMNDYRRIDGGLYSWRMPSIAYGSEAWAMFEVTISAEFSEGELAEIFSANLTGVDIDGLAIKLDAPLLKLPVINSQAYAAIAEDELVKRRLDEVLASEYLQRARRAVQHGDWDRADGLLQDAKVLFRSSPWAQDVLASMELLAKKRDDAYFMKEAMFSNNKMKARLSSKQEDASLVLEADSISFLRRKTAQGKSQFFKDDDVDVIKN
jgi:Ca-activated chloride channel family protein